MTSFYDLPIPSKQALQKSLALSACIRKAIDDQGGQISFADFMALALYHPEFGYYNVDTLRLGAEGDFTTAPEISPLFARCFATSCMSIFSALHTKHILEVGAGSGRFAYDLLQELARLQQLPEKYMIYEISPGLRKQQQQFLKSTCPAFFDRITWLSELPACFTGIIIANEVLDALPVHCFRIENKEIKERCVTYHDDRFVWQLSEPTINELTEEVNLLCERYNLENGYESEINLHMPAMIETIANALSSGMMLFADYGYGQQEYYHSARRQGTLTCFYQHRKHHDPLILPGLQDITAHVDFTRLADYAFHYGCELYGYTTQAAFLLGSGLLDLAAKEEENLSPTEEFKLHQAIKTLTLPTEMGERIKIMSLGKNIDVSLPGFTLQDRRRDLSF